MIIYKEGKIGTHTQLFYNAILFYEIDATC